MTYDPTIAQFHTDFPTIESSVADVQRMRPVDVAAEFCDRLRAAREATGISRSELARRVGVQPSAAIQWEQQRGTRPSTGNMMQIATVTNVAFEWLATGRGLARAQLEAPGSEATAVDLFEESLLKLSRALPHSARGPLLALLRTFA